MKSLRKIQEIENKIGATITEGKLEGYFETVKNHTLVHYTPFIAFFESPEEFSTQAGEHHHIKKVKALYARSNRRNPEAYMLKLEQRNLNLSKLTIQSTKLRTPIHFFNRKKDELKKLSGYLLPHIADYPPNITKEHRSELENLVVNNIFLRDFQIKNQKSKSKSRSLFTPP